MKKRMKISKALEEVWEWKDRCYEEARGMRLLDYLKRVHADVERLLNERLVEKERWAERDSIVNTLNQKTKDKN